MKDIITLAVESSCDETSVAVLKNGREVLSNIINTQVDLHKKFGGVVPEVASRKHIENIDVYDCYSINPLYIRKSQAEVQYDEKMKRLNDGK